MKHIHCIFVVVIFIISVDAVKKVLIDEINLCKRDDPNLEKCYCDNYRKLTPLLKDGSPQMNMQPLDPAFVENIRMDFTQSQSVKMIGDMIDVEMSGLSKSIANVCKPYMTKDGIQLYFEVYIPVITLKSKFKAKGNFLLVAIDANGDFNGEFNNLLVKSVWNSTQYTKKGHNHLKFTANIQDMQIDKIRVHFNNLIGNNTELNDNINLTINENIESLYNELKPIILETMIGITLKMVNDFYAAFPFETLYPL